MTTKSTHVRCAVRTDTSYDLVSPALETPYKPASDSLRDLVPLALSRWCESLSGVRGGGGGGGASGADAELPQAVTSMNKTVLAQHWKVIIAKTSKSKPPQPFEDTDQALNVDRFLTAAYRRTQSDSDAAMPEIWIIPLSAEATSFAIRVGKATKHYPRGGEAADVAAQQSSSTVAGSALHRHDDDDDYDSDAANYRRDRVEYDSGSGGATDSASPERLLKWFDRQYVDLVDRRRVLFRHDCSTPAAASTSHLADGYVHWSDLLAQKPSAAGGGGGGGRGLRTLRGDKSALSEALGAAWQAAAEAEQEAAAVWARVCHSSTAALEASTAAMQSEAAAARTREAELARAIDAAATRRAQLEAKKERLQALRNDVRVLEVRIDAAHEARAAEERQRQLAREAERSDREKYLRESERSPLLRHLDDVAPATALEAAISLLSPTTAADVSRALRAGSGRDSANSSSFATHHDDYPPLQQQQRHYADYHPSASNATPPITYSPARATAMQHLHDHGASDVVQRRQQHEQQLQQYGRRRDDGGDHRHHSPDRFTAAYYLQQHDEAVTNRQREGAASPRHRSPVSSSSSGRLPSNAHGNNSDSRHAYSYAYDTGGDGGAGAGVTTTATSSLQAPLRALAADLDTLLAHGLATRRDGGGGGGDAHATPASRAGHRGVYSDEDDVAARRRILDRLDQLKGSLSAGNSNTRSSPGRR